MLNCWRDWEGLCDHLKNNFSFDLLELMHLYFNPNLQNKILMWFCNHWMRTRLFYSIQWTNSYVEVEVAPISLGVGGGGWNLAWKTKNHVCSQHTPKNPMYTSYPSKITQYKCNVNDKNTSDSKYMYISRSYVIINISIQLYNFKWQPIPIICLMQKPSIHHQNCCRNSHPPPT